MSGHSGKQEFNQSHLSARKSDKQWKGKSDLRVSKYHVTTDQRDKADKLLVKLAKSASEIKVISWPVKATCDIISQLALEVGERNAATSNKKAADRHEGKMSMEFSLSPRFHLLEHGRLGSDGPTSWKRNAPTVELQKRQATSSATPRCNRINLQPQRTV